MNNNNTEQLWFIKKSNNYDYNNNNVCVFLTRHQEHFWLHDYYLCMAWVTF